MSYIGFGTERGVLVHDDEAFNYVMDKLQNADKQLQREVVEWFFSGNFVHEEET